MSTIRLATKSARIVGLLLIALFAACGKGSDGSGKIAGAGASFPQPLYAKWIAAYQEANPRVQLSYESVGSGAGIRRISERVIDFGASDFPMNDDQLARAPAPLVHLPMTLGAVVVTYNLPAEVPNIRLTPPVLADIYLGVITKWNDKRILDLNPKLAVALGVAVAPPPALGLVRDAGPAVGRDAGTAARDGGAQDLPISVVHRSDGSGTTAVFTDYLSRVSPTWRDRAGSGTNVNWPTGIGARGNDGIGETIHSIPGAIGYTELVFSMNKNLPAALLMNRTGQFVEPNDASITAAAESVADKIPDDLRVSLVDTPSPLGYPLATFSYLLVYADNPDDTKAHELARFLSWGAVDGQKLGAPLHYTPLPSTIAARVIGRIHTLTTNGKPAI